MLSWPETRRRGPPGCPAWRCAPRARPWPRPRAVPGAPERLPGGRRLRALPRAGPAAAAAARRAARARRGAALRLVRQRRPQLPPSAGMTGCAPWSPGPPGRPRNSAGPSLRSRCAPPAAAGCWRRVPASPAVVVATPGAEPVADGGYAAAVLLDGWALLGRASLRAAEEALRRWMNAAALVRPGPGGGTVVVVAAASLPAVQALIRWDPATFADRELAERRSCASRRQPGWRRCPARTARCGHCWTAPSCRPGLRCSGPVPVPGGAPGGAPGPGAADSPRPAVPRPRARKPTRSGSWCGFPGQVEVSWPRCCGPGRPHGARRRRRDGAAGAGPGRADLTMARGGRRVLAWRPHDGMLARGIVLRPLPVTGPRRAAVRQVPDGAGAARPAAAAAAPGQPAAPLARQPGQPDGGQPDGGQPAAGQSADGPPASEQPAGGPLASAPGGDQSASLVAARSGAAGANGRERPRMPPVRLAPRDELAAAARVAPLLRAAADLSRWAEPPCQPARRGCSVSPRRGAAAAGGPGARLPTSSTRPGRWSTPLRAGWPRPADGAPTRSRLGCQRGAGRVGQRAGRHPGRRGAGRAGDRPVHRRRPGPDRRAVRGLHRRRRPARPDAGPSPARAAPRQPGEDEAAALSRALETLADLGVVELGTEEAAGGLTVTLSPLGVWGVHRRLRGAGLARAGAGQRGPRRGRRPADDPGQL